MLQIFPKLGKIKEINTSNPSVLLVACENEFKILLEKKEYDAVKQTIQSTKNQNIRVRLLRQRKQKKFHHLKFKPKQPQQFTTTKKEDTSAESTDLKTLTERSYAAAAEKGNSKTNLQIRRSNSNLRRALSKTNVQDKSQRSLVQQLNTQNNENIFYNRNTLTATKDATSEKIIQNTKKFKNR